MEKQLIRWSVENVIVIYWNQQFHGIVYFCYFLCGNITSVFFSQANVTLYRMTQRKCQHMKISPTAWWHLMRINTILDNCENVRVSIISQIWRFRVWQSSVLSRSSHTPDSVWVQLSSRMESWVHTDNRTPSSIGISWWTQCGLTGFNGTDFQVTDHKLECGD